MLLQISDTAQIASIQKMKESIAKVNLNTYANAIERRVPKTKNKTKN
jgi:hypothetical protein